MTKLVIFGTIVSLLIYDVYAFYSGGQSNTISWTVLEISHEFPVFTFFLGYVMGHLTWRMKDAKQVEKK